MYMMPDLPKCVTTPMEEILLNQNKMIEVGEKGIIWQNYRFSQDHTVEQNENDINWPWQFSLIILFYSLKHCNKSYLIAYLQGEEHISQLHVLNGVLETLCYMVLCELIKFIYLQVERQTTYIVKYYMGNNGH